MAKIPRVPVEYQITTLSMVKIAIKFSPCITFGAHTFFFDHEEHSESMWPYILFDSLSFHNNYSSDQLEKILEYSLNIVESIRVV